MLVERNCRTGTLCEALLLVKIYKTNMISTNTTGDNQLDNFVMEIHFFFTLMVL